MRNDTLSYDFGMTCCCCCCFGSAGLQDLPHTQRRIAFRPFPRASPVLHGISSGCCLHPYVDCLVSEQPPQRGQQCAGAVLSDRRGLCQLMAFLHLDSFRTGQGVYAIAWVSRNRVPEKTCTEQHGLQDSATYPTLSMCLPLRSIGLEPSTFP